ncbi:MAG TPA: hypothetical protein VJU81_21815 [Methylomirabilota bacterium]|nr:hypothetical protein [Methylomirabilota bacterium]
MRLDPGSPLREALAPLVRRARLVFLSGLPGTGKSLLIRVLAELAHEAGRSVSLLQWDVARPVMEGHAAAAAYPARDGVTHGVVRLAVGQWARGAVARWHARHAGSPALLLGETPLAGHRLVELARPADDAAEPLLAAETARFVIPVPSVAVRAHLEAERGRRAANPLHPREREDAPPAVLRDLWRQLAHVGAALGLAPAPDGAAVPPYDPALYAAVYRHVLRRRHADVLPIGEILPGAATRSPYELGVPAEDLRPEPEEVPALIAAAARAAGSPAALEGVLARWYLTP